MSYPNSSFFWLLCLLFTFIMFFFVSAIASNSGFFGSVIEKISGVYPGVP